MRTLSPSDHEHQASDPHEPSGRNAEPPEPERSACVVPTSRRRVLDDLGQATTEYALVLLAAAMVGLLVIGWATAGGGAAAIGALFNRVISSVAGKL